jgi:hypothetical protein
MLLLLQRKMLKVKLYLLSNHFKKQCRNVIFTNTPNLGSIQSLLAVDISLSLFRLLITPFRPLIGIVIKSPKPIAKGTELSIASPKGFRPLIGVVLKSPKVFTLSRKVTFARRKISIKGPKDFGLSTKPSVTFMSYVIIVTNTLVLIMNNLNNGLK